MTRLLLHLFTPALFALLTLSALAAPTPTIPDFTKGETPKDIREWTLGPTGLRGVIFSANGHTRTALQILVKTVEKGSPADGVFLPGDVIIGLNGVVFGYDARVSFAKAITAAESGMDGGKLRLLRWRNGKSEPAELTLPVLGSYSATAPYDCEKSKRIFLLGCTSLAQRMSAADYAKGKHSIVRSMNALALLASGNRDYAPLIKREAEWAAAFQSDGYISWDYGYLMMFLSEYVMATQDVSVMPGLTRLALETARGQSAVGTWGHRFSPNGVNLLGYGAMNQPGLSLTIGMVLAREAGVKHADLDRGISRAASFLRWYVDKGAIPYGDHLPFFAHEDNGKCASAAVLFDLLGDREAAEFFTKMTTAAYSERERGHTGNFFNMLWAQLGVARSGPLGIGAYMREQSWYYDFVRKWDTSFPYQGSPVGEEESGSHKGWDCSGSYLLGCALPLKSLRLTGKKPFIVRPMDAAQVAEVIAAGRDFSYRGDENHYEKRETAQLLAGLQSWSPFVRGRSAAALGKRDGDFLPALLALLRGKNAYGRYGAVEALGALGTRADSAAPLLRAALQDTDPWLQCLAARSLPEMSKEERKTSVSDLLAMAMRTNPADPRRHTALYASMALFSPFPGQRGPRSILAESLEGVDREKLYPAIQSLLAHEDSVARGSVKKAFSHMNDEDLVALLPAILKAVEQMAPSNEMFADSVRLGGLDLLSRLHIREGLPLAVNLIEPSRWGSGNRLAPCLESLARYGTHAQTMLPKLEELRAKYIGGKPGSSNAKQLELMDAAIAKIKASTATPTLVSVSEFRGRTAGAK